MGISQLSRRWNQLLHLGRHVGGQSWRGYVRKIRRRWRERSCGYGGVWRGLLQERLVKCDCSKISVLANCHLRRSDALRPLNIGDTVAVYRCLGVKVFLEIVIGSRSDGYQIAIG